MFMVTIVSAGGICWSKSCSWQLINQPTARSGGGAGEPCVPGEREQPGDLPDAVHALLAVAVGDGRDQLHGHGVPACPPRRLPLRRLLHHLHHLHRQRLRRVHGTPPPSTNASFLPLLCCLLLYCYSYNSSPSSHRRRLPLTADITRSIDQIKICELVGSR